MSAAVVTPIGFVLPPAFPVTGVGIVSVLLLHVYQFQSVMGARKASGVRYPNLYASDAEAKADPKKMQFNCVQRAHANTLENLPVVLGLFGYVSLFYPQFATGSIVAWVAGRFFYTVQYATGKPEARNNGLALLQYPGLFSLIGAAIYTTGASVAALYIQ